MWYSNLRAHIAALVRTQLSTCKSVNKQGSLWYLLDAIDTLLTEDLEGNASLFHRAIAKNMEEVQLSLELARNETVWPTVMPLIASIGPHLGVCWS